MDRREGPEAGAAAWDGPMGKGGGKSLLAWPRQPSQTRGLAILSSTDLISEWSTFPKKVARFVAVGMEVQSVYDLRRMSR